MPQKRMPERSADDWLVAEEGLDPAVLCARETRLTVGNGYLGTRGSLLEGRRGAWPATYIAGVFDQRDATVVDLVNAPDWLATEVLVGSQRLDVDSCLVRSHHETLDLRTGVLHRATVFSDGEGRLTRLATARFASIDNRHIVAIRVQLTPLNHDAPITITSGLDGDTCNLDRTPFDDLSRFDPTERWRKWATSRHTRHVDAAAAGDRAYLEAATFDRDIQIGYAMEIEGPSGAAEVAAAFGHDDAKVVRRLESASNVTLTLDKFVAVATSRDRGEGAASVADRSRAMAEQAREQGFDALLERSSVLWADRWEACDCRIAGDTDATRAIRFNLYHLLIAANPDDPTVSVGAKALSGEAYKGHVFWDTEIFMLPFFIYTQPSTARTLLAYRYETLDGARANARQNGYEGAQFAWESADSGAETTPKWTPDGLHRIWTGEEEVHITADVVYAIDAYVQASGDTGFMADYGLEIAIEAARFWASRLEHDARTGRYQLTRVIGPDEFHEHVDNNYYTNVLARWTLNRAADLVETFAVESPAALEALRSEVSLDDNEPAKWRAMAAAVHVPPAVSHPEGERVLAQFDGYLDLLDIPIAEWDGNDMPIFPDGYGDFNCGETTLIKQPDVVMLMYLLPDVFDAGAIRSNYQFYERRTMHRSSLSPAIHAVMGIEAGLPSKAVQYFRRSAHVDLVDNQGNTRDGIHIASAGGTWLSAVAGFGGFRVRGGEPSFDPWLPAEWSELTFRLKWRGLDLGVSVRAGEITLEWPAGGSELVVRVSGREHRIQPGETATLNYGRRSGDRQVPEGKQP